MNTSVVADSQAANSIDTGAYERLAQLLASDLRATNELILARLRSRAPLIPRLTEHLLAAGGKRLRPLLTLACAQLCGYRGVRHHGLAACVEFIHTATLLHDDVVDSSDMRRGQQSANSLFGNQSSVLVGDFLFARAFELMVADGDLEVLRILSNAAATIAEGEVLQLSVSKDLASGHEIYMEIVRSKTAALFAAACEVGAVLAARGRVEQQALHAYGMNLGIAFQLVDDVLDYSAAQLSLGKETGNDFREGKMTLPVLLAFQRGDAGERAFWQRTIVQHEQVDGDFVHAQQLIDAHDTVVEARSHARTYAATADAALADLPASEIKGLLSLLTQFVANRVR